MKKENKNEVHHQRSWHLSLGSGYIFLTKEWCCPLVKGYEGVSERWSCVGQSQEKELSSNVTNLRL